MQRMELKKLIRIANLEDIQIISDIAVIVRKSMLNGGLNQWLGDYPAYQDFHKDFLKDGLFVLEEDNQILGSLSILPEDDLAYLEVHWESDKALVIHRILVNPLFQGKGKGKEMINYAIQKGQKEGFTGIKIDTHPNNIKMQKMLKSLDFVYRGYLSSINRLAYELKIVEEK